jgi:hypothetical protein
VLKTADGQPTHQGNKNNSWKKLKQQNFLILHNPSRS